MNTQIKSNNGTIVARLAPAVLAAFVLAACGGSAAPTATEAAPAAAATTEAATEAAAGEATTEAAAATIDATTEDTAATEAVATEVAAVEPAAPAKLNLNTVTGEELLATIPGFGNRMVREFEEYRPYVSILQFRKEIGKYVDAAQVAEYEQYVFVPIEPNESDEVTLQQLPGVDAAISAQLIVARPYESNEAFLTKLAELTSAENAAAAAAYLESE